MIYSLSGRIRHVEDGFFVVECGGVGYLCKASATTLSQLPPTGSEVFVYTYLNVTQDGVDLYGFFDRAEKDCFLLLTGVSGIGPKAALSILSEFTPDALALAIASGDTKTLTRAKGIGPKAAQRIVLELRDKMIGGLSAGTYGFGEPSGPIAQIKGNAAEAVAAMGALGYSPSEAAAAVGRLPQEMSVEDMIKTALRSLAMR
ncbi:MAG TPA: Holliday junction branch migration protein RuvA [Oscillospiraceae bacterium]|nr:Holliday junction branch migration protein RuvA [Oscillospiraceae bacterium]HNW03774.1 Holliday junction branch migration protein RuvA [Oscillospiraceae bacterium]HPV99639.1 Holliday junction branch migration protein RuvA [Oscillospiraceae bacterium]